MNLREFVDTSGEQPVRGFLHTPAVAGSACLILTHGAGANCQTPLLVALADAFAAAGFTVLRCDLPFRQAKPSGPPMRSAERDQAGLRGGGGYAAGDGCGSHLSWRAFVRRTHGFDPGGG